MKVKIYIGTYAPADRPGIWRVEADLENREFKVLDTACGVDNPSWILPRPDGSLVYCVEEVSPDGKLTTFRNDDMLPYIEDGTIDASVCDKAYMCAFFGVNALFWYNNDIVNPINGWKEKGISPFFNTVDSGVMVITKDNVNDFKHQQ